MVFKPRLRKNLVPLKMHKSFKTAMRRSVCLAKYNFGIFSATFSLVTYNQLESMRRFLSRRLSKKLKRIIYVHLTHTMYKKSSKSRMGKGIGRFYKWFGYIRRGMLLFEFNIFFTKRSDIPKLFGPISTKLPFSVHFIRMSRFVKLARPKWHIY